MFSRRGVELPLVGGPPQGFTGIPGTPSWAWISLARLEKSLLEAAISCDGEPAPERVVPDILAEGKPGGSPKGERTAPPEVGSTGDVFDVGDVERFWLEAACAKLPIVKCSDLAVDIIDYRSDRHQTCRDCSSLNGKSVLSSQYGRVMGRVSEFELEVGFLAAVLPWCRVTGG